MMHINRVQLLGYLGGDPKRLGASADRPVAAFSIATTAKWRTDDGERQEATEWHSIVTFGALADQVLESLKKGSAALVEGRLQTRTWTADDGTERRTVEILAGKVYFLDRRPEAS